MKVLIVDDSRAMRRLHREVLSCLGDVDVIEAEDGVKAILALDENGFDVDLILVDWMMPNMDGLTLVQHLKSTENLSGIPILMVTSCSDERRMREAWKAGVDGYLLKPFTEDLFLHALVSLAPDQAVAVPPPADSTAENELDSQSFLDGLPAEMRRRLLDMSVVVDLAEEHCILSQGDVAEYFYFVVSGRVTEEQSAIGCSAKVVRDYGPGECFAVTELMAGDPVRSAFSCAVASSVGRVPKAAFEGMLVKFPQISVTLSRFLAGKARDMRMKGETTSESSSDLSGRLEVLDLPAIVQAINLRQKTCEIVLPELEARICFVHGQIVAVHLEEFEGVEAFYRVLQSTPKTFRLVAKSSETRRNVHVSTTRLLLDCARIMDEGSATVNDALECLTT